uniref:Uncharacterized protein n=1 Tax=Onchocerca volvulus TaxID=6282 RepID=A0A8R1TKN2_ONCVO
MCLTNNRLGIIGIGIVAGRVSGWAGGDRVMGRVAGRARWPSWPLALPRLGRNSPLNCGNNRYISEHRRQAIWLAIHETRL